MQAGAEVTAQAEKSGAADKAPRSGYVRGKRLAPYLSTSERTLWRWVAEGRMPKPVQLAPRFTVWAWADIHAWLDERAKASAK